MQGPNATEAAHDELLHLKRRLQSVAVGVRDDKAAQDEEEINEQEAVTDERQVVDVVGGFEMEQHDT
jgi:hypothetical protein